ncbi:hypothetical protein K466DRAFT_606658 [Polyporus arcularius HHB13444]|uniref:Uncharacterized protein n=1 Tax=Polyporus arcularius HHB13444 TaxID=1314778 RepID=A0A5C3NNH8_9APHY|nr:hypothetical protein K466DRAFT_606658 [Polyporus arcularius HHB13444]
MAFPPTPDGLTVRRWNAGIARELWVAIRAMGICSAAEAISNGGNDSGSHNCAAMVMLLRHAQWDVGRNLRFDILALNRTLFLASAENINTSDLGGLADDVGSPHWWTWNTSEILQSGSLPGWWVAPSFHVGPPMQLFDSDYDDFCRGVTRLTRDPSAIDVRSS